MADGNCIITHLSRCRSPLWIQIDGKLHSTSNRFNSCAHVGSPSSRESTYLAALDPVDVDHDLVEFLVVQNIGQLSVLSLFFNGQMILLETMESQVLLVVHIYFNGLSRSVRMRPLWSQLTCCVNFLLVDLTSGGAVAENIITCLWAGVC